MVLVILVAALVGVGVLAALLYALKSQPNQAPAIGTNRPWPGSVWPSEDVAPYRSSPVISASEEAANDADAKLARIAKHQHPTQARSWMDEPGAFDRAGLVDAPSDGDERLVRVQPESRHRRHHRTR